MRREPINLLRMELREPLFYNSILLSVSNGATKLGEVSTKVYEDSSKVSKYIETLKELRIITKSVPYGEKDSSKKSIYTIKDNYFKFWYRFIFPNEGKINLLGEEKPPRISVPLFRIIWGLFLKIFAANLWFASQKKENFRLFPTDSENGGEITPQRNVRTTSTS